MIERTSRSTFCSRSRLSPSASMICDTLVARAVLIVVHDYVLISLHCLQLHERALEPLLERFARFRSPPAQPVQQNLAGRRQHVHQHRLRKRAPELHCALHVDVHDDVLSQLQHALDFRAQRAVQIPVHRRPLRELAALLPREKFGWSRENNNPAPPLRHRAASAWCTTPNIPHPRASRAAAVQSSFCRRPTAPRG